jgi:hypothetical protein
MITGLRQHRNSNRHTRHRSAAGGINGTRLALIRGVTDHVKDETVHGIRHASQFGEPLVTPAGYSGTPLWKKLGFKPGMRVLTRRAPAVFTALVAPLPDDLVLSPRLRAPVDLVHLFCKRRRELERDLPAALAAIPPDGAIWVSWPKRASGVPSDVTEDVVREVALPTGLVDVKVCAVDTTWSALKLVIRKHLRA